MLYNKDFMFLHVPKTAGKSLSRFFLEAWEKPIYGYISKGQFNDIADMDLTGVHLETGRGHENLTQSAAILKERGQDVADLRAIFLCIRNPLDLMVSNYFFMRKTYKNNLDNKNFQLAATLPFEDYCVQATMAPPERWMLLDGKMPKAMRIIRFESLSDDLRRYSEEFDFPLVNIPHLNATQHEPYMSYITPRAERAIYKHFRYLFDKGYYERVKMKPTTDREDA